MNNTIWIDMSYNRIPCLSQHDRLWFEYEQDYGFDIYDYEDCEESLEKEE